MIRHLLVTAVLSCAALTAAARHHPRTGMPGDFAFYVLSLSWSPAFCLSKPGSPECHGPKRYGFIVHGLWPQYERGWPQHCDSSAQVPDSVIQSLSGIMPSRELILHEWSTHGTCSGLSPQDYFALLRRANSGVNIPRQFADMQRPIEKSPPIIASDFQGANPALPARSVVVTCSGQTTPRLREVHICLNRDLAPRACSADVLREACRAESLIVPPIR